MCLAVSNTFSLNCRRPHAVIEAVNAHHVDFGLFCQVLQDLNGLSNSIVYGGLCRKHTSGSFSPYEDHLDEIESLSSPTESMQRSYVPPKKKRAVPQIEDDGADSIVLRSASTGSFRLTSTESAAAVAASVASFNLSSRSTPASILESGVASNSTGQARFSENRDSLTNSGSKDRAQYTLPLYLQVQKRSQGQLLPDQQQNQLSQYKQRWKSHFSKVKGVAEATQAAAHAPVKVVARPAAPLAAKVSIFASTFNMGEKDVDEAQLVRLLVIIVEQAAVSRLLIANCLACISRRGFQSATTST